LWEDHGILTTKIGTWDGNKSWHTHLNMVWLVYEQTS
jgi:hypothetical protein